MASGRAHNTLPGAPGAPGAQTAAAEVTVIVGDEELLVERAVRAAVTSVTAAREPSEHASDIGGIDVHVVAAAGLPPGELAALTAPSLFGDGCVVVVKAAQDAGKEMSAELTRLAQAPSPEAFLVVTHAGGGKNKALFAALFEAGARGGDCPSVKRFRDRLDLLRGEFPHAGRKADDRGLRAPLEAGGND